MPEQVIRFGVTDGRGHRSCTWRMFARTGAGKNDVYLVAREMGGALKASLHESCSWHLGYERRHVADTLGEEHPLVRDPYLEIWPRPGELNPGVTLAYRIIVLEAGVITPMGHADSGSIVWVPTAPAGKSVEFYVLITSPKVGFDGWPGHDSMGTQPVGHFELDNGETVWVVHAPCDTPEVPLLEGGRTVQFQQFEPSEFQPGQLRAVFFGTHEDGSKVVFDCAAAGVTPI